MGMYCFQCQETAKNSGCTVNGVCGKKEKTAQLQDLIVYLTKGISVLAPLAKEQGVLDNSVGKFVCGALFSTITNANFDDQRMFEIIQQAIVAREELKSKIKDLPADLPDCAVWSSADEAGIMEKAGEVSIPALSPNEDVRSLRELLIYGVKGVAAYTDHAAELGHEKPELYDAIMEAMASTTKDLSVDEMVALVLKAGDSAVQAMALLDEAHTSRYGNPEITKVNLGVRGNPGILISGHDLRDMEDLLEQTKGTGVDVYTHSEMLPANYYPAFKKYEHFVGNYGSSWWAQNSDFENFNGPILMTTNCIIPIKGSYQDRFFTTGLAGYPGTQHIADRQEGGAKDFSRIVELAKTCESPKEIETGEIVGGFAHAQVLALADKVVEAVKAGKIKRFIVMAGCDGRQPSRQYFTDVAEELPQDAVILTAGCAKYRYNKLPLGDIDGIPRVLDAGQCNDSYSLAVVALKLKEVFEAEDINDLPISFDVAWYEQKAVCVLLALLKLGFKGIRLGPTLPAFLSPTVAKVLVDNFDIKPTGEVKADVEAMMAGK